LVMKWFEDLIASKGIGLGFRYLSKPRADCPDWLRFLMAPFKLALAVSV